MKVKRQITKQTATEKSPEEAETLSQKKNNNNNITVSLVWDEERAGGGRKLKRLNLSTVLSESLKLR